MLTNIKKISVSSDFLSLAQDITKCQTDQLKVDCITGKYQEAILELCKCAPISLRHSYPINVFLNNFSHFTMFCSKVPVCSSDDLDCVESVEIDGQECIERCDGIIVDAINQNKPKDNSKIEQLLTEYENYKYPNKTDVPFPFSLRGNIVFVQPFNS